MNNLTNFIKNHRKAAIIALVLVLALGGAAGVLATLNQRAKKAVKTETNVTILAQKNLDQIITTKGVIQSTSKVTVYTQLNAKVEEIAVDVGDVVAAGDFLAQLETRDFEKSISELNENIATASNQQKTLINQAAKRVTDAKDQKTIDLQQKQDAIDEAQAKLDDTVEDLEDSAEDAADAKAEAAVNSDNRVVNALSVLNTARAAMNANDQEIIDLQSEIDRLNALITDGITDANESTYAGLLSTAQGLKVTANADDIILTDAYNDALAAYNNTVNAVEDDIYDDEWDDAYHKAYSAGYNAVTAAQNAYDAAVTAYNNFARSNDLTIQEKSYSLNNQKLQDPTASFESQLKTAQMNLEDATVTAPVSGTITEVIASLGARPTGPLFVIQSTDSLEISTTVAEYDIPLIHEGQSVRFTTEATGGDELTGTVDLISPTAINSDGDFEVIVRIDTPDERLRIGMNAKLTVVLESRSSVFSVPYDAITADEAGNTVVVSLEADGVTRKNIPVTVGMETDYFVEISGPDLKAGLTILNDPEGKNVVVEAGPAGAANAG